MMLQSVIVILIVILDQLTKYLAKINIKPLESQSIPFIRNVFHFTYVENRGAAFSILQNQRWFFIIITFIFVGYAAYYLIVHPKEKPILKVSLSMIMGGAIGNLIDRIRFGYVVDFFDFRAINFAVFNVADCAVVLGCILMGVYLMLISGKEENKKLT